MREVQEMGITHDILLRTYVPNRKVEAQKARQDMYMKAGAARGQPDACSMIDCSLDKCTRLCALLILRNGCTPKQVSLPFGQENWKCFNMISISMLSIYPKHTLLFLRTHV